MATSELRQIEALRRRLNADERVELAAPQVAEDFHAVERRDLGVQIAAGTRPRNNIRQVLDMAW